MALVIERGRCVSLEQFRVPDGVAKWRAQVVGDGIGKRFQFLVAGFELRSPLGKFPVQFADFVLSLSALFHFNLKVVAGMTKIALDSAANRSERGNNQRPCYEKQK